MLGGGKTAMHQALWVLILGAAGVAALGVPNAHADFISSVPLAANYSALYEGTGGHNLQINNDTVSGNVGVGGTGHVQFNGPGTIGGSVNFSAANTGQFSNNNGANVGPTGVNYNNAAVTTALNEVNGLSTSLGAETGTAISFNGSKTIDASTGHLDLNGNYVFNVTSYSETNAGVVTIQNAGGHSVVFNFASNNNVNLGGSVTLVGLTPDQVLWNFTSSGKNVSLTNNGETFQGDILAPNDVISLSHTNLDGRVWGGDSQDMQIVSGANIFSPTSPVPEPASLLMLATALAGFGALRRRQAKA